eukprot:CAMPEP_0202716564 /NCGR_PEP_ID=MMETSP1385-20130828/102468_1 /ASSEMBLY_ACC=CAM_ASM_000861 /TAXON_ID=933848 /ORGANISM="Elphidium margaritaceum" /LENGTH=64 /DNA_ID=CAMNT_0049378375 /DNA_START=61 /DNA_END=252 /DNA_ORIENTATION=-
MKKIQKHKSDHEVQTPVTVAVEVDTDSLGAVQDELAMDNEESTPIQMSQEPGQANVDDVEDNGN